MNKAEFIAAIQDLPNFSGLVSGPTLENTNEAGDEQYVVNIRFVKGITTYYHNIYFVVVKPGLPAEAVYFLVEPTDAAQTAAQIEKRLA